MKPTESTPAQTNLGAEDKTPAFKSAADPAEEFHKWKQRNGLLSGALKPKPSYKITEDELWASLTTPESEGGYGLPPWWHKSDLFCLLTEILAFHQARGTTPEKMLGPVMKRRIHWRLTGEWLPEEHF